MPLGPNQRDGGRQLGWPILITADSASAYTAQFCLSPLQPEAHAHLTVHRRGGCQVLLGLRAFAGPPVELAEAELAMGHERAHLEL